MQRTRNPRRAFEETLRAPFSGLAEERKGRPGRQYYYERLMQVSIRHRYYNKEGFECPDFLFLPTPAATELMTSLGLLFKNESTGFSVLYDVNRREGLFEYLRRQGRLRRLEGIDDGQVWTRLSVVLALNNACFVNFTDIPISVDPVKDNFYFSNQQAHEREGRTILNPGRRVSARELLPVVLAQVPVPVTREVREVQVRAISGEEVLCKPRCVPAGLLGTIEAAQITCAEARECGQDDPRCVCASKLYLDFSRLPEDKYTIQEIGYNGEPVNDPIEVLYTTARPVPLCFIDLLFTDPAVTERPASRKQKKRGIYPIVDLWDEAKTRVAPAHYFLEFENRSTRWNYYIVPQPQIETFEDLSIENRSLLPVSFSGPCRVRLANGAKAYRFMSDEPLPLQQQSDLDFRLWGRHGGMTHKGVLIERMPVASADQVIPLSDEAACRDLLASLCPDVEPGEKCCDLIRRLCRLDCGKADFNKSLERIRSSKMEYRIEAPSRRQRLPNNNYSDTYVYV